MVKAIERVVILGIPPFGVNGHIGGTGAIFPYGWIGDGGSAG